MIHKVNRSGRELAVYGAFAMAMAVLCFSQTDPKAGIPARSELANARGQLAWVEEHKYGTRFGLVGIAASFDYRSKAGGMQTVRRALEYAGSSTISVDYANDELSSQKKDHEVWVLSVGSKTIRTFEETRTSWEGDNRLIPWIGAMMLAMAAFFGVHARRACRVVPTSP